MCILSVETTVNFKKLFEYFFECMDENIPKTIITDDQKAIGLALDQLKIEKQYEYIHLLDWFHKIENMKRKLKRERNS